MKTLALLKLLTSSLLIALPFIFVSCSTQPPAQAYEAPKNNTADKSLRSGDFKITRNSIDSILNSPAPKSRPGLGTGWGNEVASNVHFSSFNRGSSKPTSVAAIYYNDKEGVAAMTKSWRYTGSGMQRSANGLVEWGVKGNWSMLKNYNSGSRRYVVGRKGGNYSLEVKNLCRSRLEVVLSVDGLDVMDGRAASFGKRGYIIQPGKTLSIKGFRTSESAVASFKFSSVSSSYSNIKHGTTRNVGVIGIAVFTEKGVDPWKWSRRTVRQRHGASPFAEAPDARAR